jgi:hypothetical protein
MKKDNDEIDHGKIAFQGALVLRAERHPEHVPAGQPAACHQGPKEVMMIKQGGQEVRHIYLNVPHSANVKPSWYGESVGHYEGDTLVVDTIGQNAKTVVDCLPHAAYRKAARGRALASHRRRKNAGSPLHRGRSGHLQSAVVDLSAPINAARSFPISKTSAPKTI